MIDRMKNLAIGLFVTVALSIIVGMVFFLKPKVGDGKKTLQVRFTNIAGISKGTRVTYAGKPVGAVVQVTPIGDARTRDENTDPQGRIYTYLLTLCIDSKIDVFNTDEIAMKTTGLMGERSIAILPKAAVAMTRPITNEIMSANATEAMENTFQQVSKAASRMESVAASVDQWIKGNEAQVTNTLKSLTGAMAQIDHFLCTIDNQKLTHSVKESLDVLSDNMRLVKSSLDSGLLERFSDFMGNLDQSAVIFNNEGHEVLKNINNISYDIANGRGTFGQLLTGNDFYLRLASLMNKSETLMNDINHYGLLFQYNKGWQKSRTKKANLLKSLDTPQEFRRFFETEVDSMTTSLGRLSELVERAGGEEREQIYESEAFKDQFAHLMRQVQGLSDSLKLYNESLIAKKE